METRFSSDDLPDSPGLNSPYFNQGVKKMNADPMQKTKDDYADIIDHISLPESPVGIDAKFTHAIIIAYLQQISTRLDDIEAQLKTQ
jgi:hypothetical protein